MIRIVMGSSVVTVSLALLVVVVWCWWLAGTGRHRAPRRSPTGAGRTLLVTTAAPLLLPSASPVLPARDGEEEPGRDADTMALLQDVDRADFGHCPAEGRTTPHFFHRDGSRTCARCETTTAGDPT